jgi:hypothetical protein
MKQLVLWFFYFLAKGEFKQMKNRNHIREITASGLFTAIGVLLPVIFHALGLGSAFLPMHIPALMAGFILSVPYAAAVGAATPLLSSLMTGMPPAFPVMPYMVFELAAYASVVSILRRKFKLNPYLSLIVSMAAGRAVSGIAVWILTVVFGAQLPGPLVFVSGAVVTGLPGIILQLVVIPPLIMILYKKNMIGNEVV